MPRCRGGGSSTDQWLYRLTCVVWMELSQRESELTITGSMQTALEVQQAGIFPPRVGGLSGHRFPPSVSAGSFPCASPSGTRMRTVLQSHPSSLSKPVLSTCGVPGTALGRSPSLGNR